MNTITLPQIASLSELATYALRQTVIHAPPFLFYEVALNQRWRLAARVWAIPDPEGIWHVREARMCLKYDGPIAKDYDLAKWQPRANHYSNELLNTGLKEIIVRSINTIRCASDTPRRGTGRLRSERLQTTIADLERQCRMHGINPGRTFAPNPRLTPIYRGEDPHPQESQRLSRAA